MPAFPAFLWPLLAVCWSMLSVHAYVPATPSNVTDAIQPDGTIGSGTATLTLQYYPGERNVISLDYLLTGADSTGVTKGAFVHFSEDNLTHDNTNTPWIALVSCDANATNAAQTDDIFTLAKNRGAVSAVLYSNTAAGCAINSDFGDPSHYDQVMDVFSTFTLESVLSIQATFGNTSGPQYDSYNASLLNITHSDVVNTIDSVTPPSPGFLTALLVTSNTSGIDNSTQSSTSQNPDNGPDSGPNTSLAMIILYAITGCVSALFCVVIISGAIRAIRHPERYGPRAGDTAFGGPPGALGQAQSRARGLARAVLDTFPVVKFGRTEEDAAVGAPKDLEAAAHHDGDTSIDTIDKKDLLEMDELHEREHANADEGGEEDAGETSKDGEGDAAEARDAAEGTSSGESESAGGLHAHFGVTPRPRRREGASAAGPSSGEKEKDVVPDAIGRETCPICIIDFEEGDDLRVLPCEGHHRFHRDCVDQWLLELSSSCPLCRQDFQALQTMIAGDALDTLEPPHPHRDSMRPISTAATRFSRYLRFARRRHNNSVDIARSNREGQFPGYDPTDPAVPAAPERV